MKQAHVEPLTNLLIKSKQEDKSEKGFVKLKLCKDTTSATSELYEFKIYLFDNGEPDEFWLLQQNFNMNLVASKALTTSTKIQYLFTIVHR